MYKTEKVRRGKKCHQFLDDFGNPVPDRLVEISNLRTMELLRFQLECHQDDFHASRIHFQVRRRLGDVLIIWMDCHFRYRFTSLDCKEYVLRYYEGHAVKDVNPNMVNTGTYF